MRIYLATFLIFIYNACTESAGNNKSVYENQFTVERWITTGDQKHLLEKLNYSAKDRYSNDLPVIEVDTTQQFQSIDGFGYSLTGGSAYLIHQLDEARRSALLNELFRSDNKNIGVSYLRISIGASDLNDHAYSYNDLATGKTDIDLQNFSIAKDQKHLIPLLKEILAIAPDIKIMGSPWSAPAWMKTNNSLKGGKLNPSFYEAYANYFVKYLQAMEAEGITLDAITVQNEPENPKNNPSMVMTAEEQLTFIKNNLGPAFEKAGLRTKIIVFDHNCDHPEYPISILNDPQAKRYIDGSAFHLYLGDIEAMSKVHEAHPDKHLYFTEQWTSPNGSFKGDLMWHTRELIIGATRNWSRNVLEWNLAADPSFNPHTDEGGCTECQGALTIGDDVKRNVSYYIIGHASKFVPVGSFRVASSVPGDLHNVVFKTPSGKKVMIVVNESEQEKEFVINSNGRSMVTALPGQAVGTFCW